MASTGSKARELPELQKAGLAETQPKNQMTTDLEQKRKRIETAVKILLLCVAGFFVSPFVYATIRGLAGLAAAGVIGLVMVNLTPAVAALVANWRLKALKAVAAANPIETLENQYAERERALADIRENIKTFYRVIQDLWNQIQEHNAKYPDRPSQFTDKYNGMKQLLELRKKKYKMAQTNLVAFGQLLEEKRSDWKIAQAAAKASKLANVGQDFQTKLMQDTALMTIQDGLNNAFSELQVSLLDEDNAAPQTTVNVVPLPVHQLPEKAAGGPPSLDLDFAEEVAEPMPVKRKN